MRPLARSAALALATLVIAGPAAPGTGAPDPTGEPIRIGVYGSFSLPGSGPPMRDGARAAAEAINERGGILGRRLELVERDDAGDRMKGVRVLLELIDRERVVAVVGPSLTVVADATSPIVNERRIPEVIAAATGNPVNELIEEGADSYVFRFSLSDRIQAVMIAREAVEVLGRRRPAILHDGTSYGEKGRDRILDALRSRGVEPVHVGEAGRDDAGATAAVKAARAAGADVLLVYAVSVPATRVVRALERIGWRAELLGSWTLSQEGFVQQAGPYCEGAIMPQSFIEAGATGAESARFLAKWRARRGSALGSASSAAQAWDALHVLALAFEQAGSTDAARVRAAMENLHRPYDGVTGRHWKPWSPTDHEAIKRGDVRMGTVRDGRIVPLPPR